MKRRIPLAAAIVIVVALGATALWYHRAQTAARKWADFEACLIGSPLADNESVDYRLRGIALASPVAPTPGVTDPNAAIFRSEGVMGRPDSAPDPVTFWPTRCTALAVDLSRNWAVQSVNRALADESGTAALALARAEVPPNAGALWLAAGGLPLERPAKAVEPAPAPEYPVIDNHAPLIPGWPHLTAQGIHVQPQDRTVFSWVENRCQAVHTPKPFAKLICAPEEDHFRLIAGSRGHGAIWMAGEKKGTKIVKGDNSVVTILSGRRVRLPQHVWVDKSGVVFALQKLESKKRESPKHNDAPPKHRHRLIRSTSPTSPLDEVEMELGGWETALVEGSIVWQSDGTLWSRTLAPSGDSLIEPEYRLGPAPHPTRLRSCRSAKLTVMAAVRGRTQNYPYLGANGDRPSIALYFREADRWSAPLEVPGLPPPPKTTVGSIVIVCSATDVRISFAASALSDRGKKHELHQIRCSLSGCTPHTKTLEVTTSAASAGWYGLRPRPNSIPVLMVDSPTLVDLDTRSLVLWQGSRRIRFRLEKFEALNQAPTRTLMTRSPPPRWPSLGNAEVDVRGNAALLMVSHESASKQLSYPVRIDASGSISVLRPHGQ